MTDKGENILSDGSGDDPSRDVSEGSDYGVVGTNGASDFSPNLSNGMNDPLDHVPSQMPTSIEKVIESGNCPDQEPDEDRNSSDGSSESSDSSRDSSPSHESITAKCLKVRLITLLCNYRLRRV